VRAAGVLASTMPTKECVSEFYKNSDEQ